MVAVSDVGERIRRFWDQDAATYDAAKSHAVSDPVERAAWRQALLDALPAPGAHVLEVGRTRRVVRHVVRAVR